MNRQQTTAVDLVERLEVRNRTGKYTAIIERAKNNGYHCFKYDKIPGHPEYARCDCPKVLLAEDLGVFPELYDIVLDVANGRYDEDADPIDELAIRNMLINEQADPSIFNMVGLTPPTDDEKELLLKQTTHN